MVTFLMLYINILDGQNHVSVLSHVKDKNYFFDEDSCHLLILIKGLDREKLFSKDN